MKLNVKNMSATFRSIVAVTVIALSVFSFSANAELREGPMNKKSKSIAKQKSATTQRASRSEEKVTKEEVHYSVFRNIPAANEVKKRRR
jgi:hypothetical protein